MIRRLLSNTKLWFQTKHSISEEGKQKAIDLLQNQAIAIYVSSCRQFETLFKTLPKLLQCDKEDTSANRRYKWWLRYSYIIYTKQYERIECWDSPFNRTVVSYDEFWNTVFEKQPCISRHSLENLL